MMQLKLVSFETAKKLKEIGFIYMKANCYGDNMVYQLPDGELLNALRANCVLGYILAPTLALAQMWLREKYNIHVSIGKDVVNKLYFVEIDVWDHTRMNESLKLVQFDSYGQALEAGISEAIEVIKTKQDDTKSK